MVIKNKHPEKGRAFKLLLYPDCEYHKPVIEKFKLNQLPEYGNSPACWLGILHEGETEGKKQHYHIAVRFVVPLDRSTVANALGLTVPCGTNTDSKPDLSSISVCTGKFSDFLLYLTHKNAPDKIQYTESNLFGSESGFAEYRKAVVRYESERLETQDAFACLLEWIENQPYYITNFAFAKFVVNTPFFKLRNDPLLRNCIYEHNKPFISEDNLFNKTS